MKEYITKWYLNVKLLDRFDCVGTNLKNFPSIHFSGNFWWSRCSYIKLLQYPNFANRYTESEDWILQLADHSISKENFGILHRTSKNRYERGMVNGYIDRYPFIYYKSGNETSDIEMDKNLFHGENCNCNIK